MKPICVALVLGMAATPSLAGGLSEPVMEPAVVETQASSSAGGILVPLLVLILVAVAVSGGGGGSQPEP